MPTLNMIPDFTPDNPTGVKGQMEVVESTTESTGTEKPVGVVTETPSVPPTEEKPTNEQVVQQPVVSQNAEEFEKEKELQGLRNERAELLKEIATLRGQKREIKEDQIQRVQQEIDQLEGVHPDDVKVIEKVIRSKGYVTKDEASKMYYDSVKDEELKKFLNEFPEYKPENDLGDRNWTALNTELGFYRMPTDPHRVGELLRKAHKSIVRIPSGQQPQTVQRQIQNAQLGSGGGQRPSSSISTGPGLTSQQRRALEDGGWSEEEIKRYDQNLKV